MSLGLGPDLAKVRQRLGQGLFTMVAGPEGPENRTRIHTTPGPRWFAEDRPIRRVHADASMFVGGLRALLLQSLHPWRWRASPSIPTTGVIPGAGCNAPAPFWP